MSEEAIATKGKSDRRKKGYTMLGVSAASLVIYLVLTRIPSTNLFIDALIIVSCVSIPVSFLVGILNLRKSRKSYEETIAEFDKAIELDPNDAETYWARADVYYEHKEYEKAIADYDKAIELDPNNAWTNLHRGFAYEELGDYKKAVADLEKSLELGLSDISSPAAKHAEDMLKSLRE